MFRVASILVILFTVSVVQAEIQVGESKPNKVSKLLHFMHDQSENIVFGDKSEGAGLEDVENSEYDNMSDEEILMSLCSDRILSPCRGIVRSILKRSPKTVEEIVHSIKTKPHEVNAKKLLWHKLLESSIKKIEDNRYDEVADMALNIALKRNPYVYVASKVADKTIKYVHGLNELDKQYSSLVAPQA